MVLAALVVLSACLPSAGVFAASRLTFAGGPAGGAWYGLAGSIAEQIKTAFPDVLVTVIPGGGVGNPTLVETGKAQLGLTVAHLYQSARLGTDPYETVPAKHIRAVAEVGTSDMGLFLVKKSVPVNSIKELKEKKYPLRLTTTSKASTPALAAERLLNEYGITFAELQSWGGSVTFTSYADAVTLISDGHADAIIAPVVPAVVELTTKTAMKWLDPEESVVEKMAEKYGYAKNFIPKGKFVWAEKDGWTIGEPNVIIVRDDVPENVVYGIVKIICENPGIVQDWGTHHALFDPKNAWRNVGGPLHPGAERYFREKGWMK
jgi:TRAP transporter TAXI family solute receptor